MDTPGPTSQSFLIILRTDLAASWIFFGRLSSGTHRALGNLHLVLRFQVQPHKKQGILAVAKVVGGMRILEYLRRRFCLRDSSSPKDDFSDIP